MNIAVIADDFTGANDAAAQFAQAGLSTATFLDRRFARSRAKDFDARAFSAESRSLEAGAARRIHRELVSSLGLAPNDIVYKKVDSGLRGNLGAEIEGVLQGLAWPTSVALLAPAYPANGRTTEGGRQFIHGVPADESEMASDPIAPVREAHLPTLIKSQTNLRAATLGSADAERGPAHLRERFAAMAAAGVRVIVADATTREHLEALAEAALQDGAVVPCGSAGLSEAIARLVSKTTGSTMPLTSPKRLPRPALAVVGSKSPTARRQVAAAQARLRDVGFVAVDPRGLAGEQAEARIQAAAEAAAAALERRGAGVIYASASQDASHPIDPKSVVAGLGRLARAVVGARGVAALFLTGGDTAKAVCDELGVKALELLGELKPGIVWARAIGGIANGVRVVTKAGSFGDDGTLCSLLQG